MAKRIILKPLVVDHFAFNPSDTRGTPVYPGELFFDTSLRMYYKDYNGRVSLIGEKEYRDESLHMVITFNGRNNFVVLTQQDIINALGYLPDNPNVYVRLWDQFNWTVENWSSTGDQFIHDRLGWETVDEENKIVPGGQYIKVSSPSNFDGRNITVALDDDELKDKYLNKNDNSVPFNPSHNHNPSTKKYVDDRVYEIENSVTSVFGRLGDVVLTDTDVINALGDRAIPDL